MKQLANKVILITGAFGQAGQSAVKMFLERGAIVIANDILGIELFPEMLLLLNEYGARRFVFIKADSNEEDQVKALLDDIDRQFGRLDGSYHNVYASVEKPALEISLGEWESTIKGTLTSTFLVCKYALPLMIQSGGGVILNTSSVLGIRPQKNSLAYGTAKAAVNHFTRTLAATYAKQGIRANVLIPGDFKSDAQLGELSEEIRREISDITLLGRSGTTDEISEVAAFLLSDAASYVTASLYTVDGGYHI